MSRTSKLLLWALCGLLISCSTQESHWRSLEASKSGKIEYQGRVIAHAPTTENGLGGTGKVPFAQPQNGLGGTGQQARNGLGGTGSPIDQQQSNTPQNGLGGSGKQPGKTTIVGSVTAFGSIWVNDRHILLPQHTRYFRDGDHSQRDDIRLGQVVAVLAEESGSDYQALEVHSVHNVIGPLKAQHALAHGKTELQILGQRVIVDNRTRLLDQHQQPLAMNQLVAGQWLAVSGLRAPDQTIRASLVRDWPEQIALLAGPVSALQGSFMLGEQKLQFNDDIPALDQPLTLSGELENNEFIVDDWQPMPLTRLLELADEFWLEGFPMEDAELYLEGFEVQLPEAFDGLEIDDSISIGFDEDEDEFWFDDSHRDFDHDHDHHEHDTDQARDDKPDYDSDDNNHSDPLDDDATDDIEPPELDDGFEYEDDHQPEFDEEPEDNYSQG
ncbi:DUF5666 domain-containing protein [Bacterioplanoides sp.]|uniref:DUF5666 domain-containing protein n=1 Tax=Bacterioplanoides sp. TaxID=2066072 RepID=UPI003B5C2613